MWYFTGSHYLATFYSIFTRHFSSTSIFKDNFDPFQMKFLFIFNQTHLDFRIAEFLGICRIFDIEFDPEKLNTKVIFPRLIFSFFLEN